VPAAEFDPAPLLEALARHEVDFVLIGGLAAAALGSARSTFDIDIAYARTPENLERLVGALTEVEAKLRGAPADVPFLLDAETLASGLNFTFATKFGALDTLGEAAGAPKYADLKRASFRTTIRGWPVDVASLDHLIAMKEAAGRPHDKATASELRAIADELRQR
jgi:hypothetical protein